jgi:hypothetical protein
MGKTMITKQFPDVRIFDRGDGDIIIESRLPERLLFDIGIFEYIDGTLGDSLQNPTMGHQSKQPVDNSIKRKQYSSNLHTFPITPLQILAITNAHQGSPLEWERLYANQNPVPVPNRQLLFRAYVPRDTTTAKPTSIVGTTHTIHAHSDVVLYLHPADVLANVLRCRVYDSRYIKLGRISTTSLIVVPIVPNIHHESRITSLCTHMTPVYMNPSSDVIYIYLARKTLVRKTYNVGGREYVETKSAKGQWQGHGWVKKPTGTEVSDRRSEPTYTVADFLSRTHIQNAGGLERQDDAGIGFNIFLAPGALPYNAYNYTQHFAAQSAIGWDLRQTAQNIQPLVLPTVGRSLVSVDQLLQETIQTNVLDDLIDYRNADNTRGAKMLRQTFPLESPSPCLVLTVCRQSQLHSPNVPTEDLPIRPSETVTLFGRPYHLVSMTIQKGHPSGGHWKACVKTTTGWFMLDDKHRPHSVQNISDISTITNGVHFIYQEAGIPLFPFDRQCLQNQGNRCWANAFSQIVRYSAVFASRIGIVGRLPSFNELLCLMIDGANKI